MPLCLSELLQRFVERRPVPVMLRSILERCVQAERLDAWFDQVSEGQYTRHLLFSTVFDRVTQVVFRQQCSVHAAYQNQMEHIGISVNSIYNKLNALEPPISAELVRNSAAQSAALIDQMQPPVTPLLPAKCSMALYWPGASIGWPRHAPGVVRRCRANLWRCWTRRTG